MTSALLTRISADGPGVTEAQVRAIKAPTLIIATAQDHVHPNRPCRGAALHDPALTPCRDHAKGR